MDSSSPDVKYTELQKFIAELWTLVDVHGGTDPGSGTSNTPGGSVHKPSLFERDLSPDELAQDHLERFRVKLNTYHPKLSAVIDEPDFQPISFLQLGLVCGQAVCRISIHYSSEKLDSLLTRLENFAAEYDKDCPKEEKQRFDPLEELKTIFSLPNNFFSACNFSPVCDSPISFTAAIKCLKKHKNELLTLNPFALGTGFLVGESHLLTNNHVLPNINVAQQCIAQFGYEDGGSIHIVEYNLDPQFLFVSDPALDYTLVQLKPDPYTKRAAGYQFDWINLVEMEKCAAAPLKGKKKIGALTKQLIDLGYKTDQIDSDQDTVKLPGDRTAIIEHPRGRKKEVVLYNNKITKKTFTELMYKSDTDYGSSGSPVFNLNWELIAITKKVVPHIKGDSQNGRWVRFVASQGTRIIRIIEDLKKRSVRDTRLQNFIENFVTTSERLNYPPLPAAIEFDGINYYTDVTGSLIQSPENGVDDFSQFSIEAWVNPHSSSTNTTIFSQVCLEPWYELFEDDSVLGKYILSLQLTPQGNVIFSREPFWQISSTNFATNGLLYPFIQSGEEQKHPLDILVSQSINQPVHIKLNDVKVERSQEKIKALQCVLYCLGFFPKDLYNSPPETYRGEFLKALSGQLDANTVAAIADFNSQLTEDSTSSQRAEKMYITISAEAIDISAGTIEVFKRRGTFLGLGTKIKSESTEAKSDQKYKNHHGLRVLELQYCLRSLDWNNPFLHSQKLPKPPEFDLDGNFSWPEQWYELSSWEKAEKTTAYAIRRLQQAYRQPNDAVFGSLALSALRQAKTYRVMTRERLPLDEFSHVAITFDGTETKICINGQVANRRYTSKHSVGHIHQAVIGARPSSPISDSQQSPYNAYFAGRLTEVRVWKSNRQPQDLIRTMHRRLDSTEIINPDLVGYWRLEEGKIEDKPQDSQEPEKQCRYLVNNLASQSSSYAFASLLEFKNANKRVNLRSACDFPTAPLPFGLKVVRELELRQPSQDSVQHQIDKPGITVECWLKFDYGEGDILSGGETQTGCYTLRWINRKLQLELLQEPDFKTKIQIQDAVPNTHAWHHVAFSWAAMSNEVNPGEVNFYLDGKLQDVTALDAKVQTKYKSSITFCSQNFYLDQQSIKILPNQKETVQTLECSISELRIWRVVRSPNEIKAHLNQRIQQEKEIQSALICNWRFDGTDQLGSSKVLAELQNDSKLVAWVSSPSKILNFTDINGHWAEPFINGLHYLGLLGAFVEDTFVENNPVQFKPHEPMKKQEFAVILLNTFGGPPKQKRANVPLQFKDKSDMKCEYCDDIEYVWRLGLISGECETASSPQNSPIWEITFKPENLINRGQVIAAIFDSSIPSTSTVANDSESEKILNRFLDASILKGQFSWIPSKTMASALKEKLVVSNTTNSNQLVLEENATRAEVAAMLYQALVYQKRAVRIESEYVLKAFEDG